MSKWKCAIALVAAAGITALSGCGSNSRPFQSAASGAGLSMKGNVHGGQQPLALSKIYLYAVSTTADAGPATSLLNSLIPGQAGYVLSDVNGNWSITGDYTCPAGASVYLLAVGGNPGLAGAVSNSKIVLATGLGACSSLSASSYFTINEATTVAMAYAFAGFETSSTQIGSATAGNVATAFANVSAYVDPVHGAVKSALPADDSVRQTIDSLSNSVAACVNSDGTGSACAGLFAATTVASSTPADTFAAAINVAQNPQNNVAAIYNLGTSNGPFQPTLAQAPATWSLYSLPAFFAGQIAAGGGTYSLTFPNGQPFGIYTFQADPHYINAVLGTEYVTDAGDTQGGVYFYDVTSTHVWYTSPSLYPYLYDYQLATYIYYFQGSSPREFYNFNTQTYLTF